MKRRLLALPLAVWEREGLKSALVKAGLPADDVGDPRQLFGASKATKTFLWASAGLKFMAMKRSCIRW